MAEKIGFEDAEEDCLCFSLNECLDGVTSEFVAALPTDESMASGGETTAAAAKRAPDAAVGQSSGAGTTQRSETAVFMLSSRHTPRKPRPHSLHALVLVSVSI